MTVAELKVETEQAIAHLAPALHKILNQSYQRLTIWLYEDSGLFLRKCPPHKHVPPNTQDIYAARHLCLGYLQWFSIV